MNKEFVSKIIDFTKKKHYFTTAELVGHFLVSRQYIHGVIKNLVDQGVLVKTGSTRKSTYIHKDILKKESFSTSAAFTKSYSAKNLEEHAVLSEIEKEFPIIRFLPENIKSIFDFTFSEMLNNAIEHSNTKRISVAILKDSTTISFAVTDAGIGVFRNIMQKKQLSNEIDAIQDLLKGKATTMPRSHSGEGIFFTSRVADTFILDSFGKRLRVCTPLSDVEIEDIHTGNRGTLVSCTINLSTKRHLSDVFRQYTNLSDESDYGFDKTEIQVRLYSVGGVYISRSQARRILSGLEKFSIVVFDFENVPVVGQAFADEIFRVFQNSHQTIKLETVHMNDSVSFMVKRAINEANRKHVR